jgi:hypothetical protein
MRQSARLVPGGSGVETAALAVAAVGLAFLVTLLPDAQALDVLACIRFYLAQGCVP